MLVPHKRNSIVSLALKVETKLLVVPSSLMSVKLKVTKKRRNAHAGSIILLKSKC